MMLFDIGQYVLISLFDIDGDEIIMNKDADPKKAISYFLNCSTKKAGEVLEELKKDYDVYATSFWQIVLAQGNKVIYNFEINGETWYNGHKYNELGKYQFIKLVEGIRPKSRKPAREKKITLTVTEQQLKKAKQLYYAKSIGFNITYKDYQKWHLTGGQV